VTLGSRTLMIDSDRGTELAGHQLRFGLQRPGSRREGSFLFEEWALVTSAGDKARVRNASSPKFAGHVQNVAERFRPRGSDTSIVLVIEDAEHPHNSREIPVRRRHRSTSTRGCRRAKPADDGIPCGPPPLLLQRASLRLSVCPSPGWPGPDRSRPGVEGTAPPLARTTRTAP
jgi:hypothetical protein